MDLGVGPGPVIVDAQPEYKVDCILCEQGNGSYKYFFVGFRGWDDSEAQGMSKDELKNALALFVEWEQRQKP